MIFLSALFRVKCCIQNYSFFLSGSHDVRVSVPWFHLKLFQTIQKCVAVIFPLSYVHIKMLTDRSPLLCHFSRLVNFSPISSVQLPKSLTIKSFSDANLYISQILAESFSINMNRNMSSSTSNGRVSSIFSIDEPYEPYSTSWRADISMNQNSLSLLVLSFILLSRNVILCWRLFESTTYMWRSSFAKYLFLVELKTVWKVNEKVCSSLKQHKENYYNIYLTLKL